MKKDTMKGILIAFSIIAVFGLFGCQPAMTTVAQTEDRFMPEPTPVGSWAGLPYNEDSNWELKVVEADEERENPYTYAYFEGQEILVNRNYGGCELSYWFGGGAADEFGEYPELFSYISFDEKIGENNFTITLHHVSGQLDYIAYAFFSVIRNAPNVFENGYLGTLRLRLINTKIDPCIREAEWLLSEINTSGMYMAKEAFYGWDYERQYGDE